LKLIKQNFTNNFLHTTKLLTMQSWSDLLQKT